ncbi:hypothetical protein [Cribrihabitans neustonicus]|uniref:hypothetical protein n=1 Tax=Cribrihabitans neustonicus TaxID=1429085 RepID=UPI003B5B2F48
MVEKDISSPEENETEEKLEIESKSEASVPLNYSRREAVKALAKYSAAVGGAAAVVVTADGLVSEASAYGSKPVKQYPGRKKMRRWKRLGKMRRWRRWRRWRRRNRRS